ncbi:thiolase domain-containing protein [Candidatus Thorarchaeota archaeon]|nr:MAG: thiolase domain-containing protein [Candidatus Thorarchaeota archaeon]
MEQVNIIGVGMTRFGVLEDSVLQLAETTAMEAISDSNTHDLKFDYLFVGTHNPDEFASRSHLSTLLADQLGIIPAGAARIESGPSSGSSAFETGVAFVASGMADLVMVVGVEKMSLVERGTAVKIINRMLSQESESRYGATPAALAALVTRRYMHEYGLTRDELSLVPVKAHRNGVQNPLAHFQMEISVEEVNRSKIVSDPLTLYDCCPTSDGAAAVILASNRLVKECGLKDQAIRILGIGHGTDYLALQHRTSLTSMNATKVAAERAFKMAQLTPANVDIYEIHDAFSILELITMEDLGLAERGGAVSLVKEGITDVTGDVPINTTGGLKARGHPTGATGIAQIRDIVLQMRGAAPKGLQIEDPTIGLTHNIGGFGNNMVVTLLEKNT